MADVTFDPRQLPLRDLRRLLGEMWDDPRCDGYARPVLETAISAGRRSLDRSLVLAWLRMERTDHPATAILQPAVHLAANRHDWPWATRGNRWQLWDRVAGPRQVAQALLTQDDPKRVLDDCGLDNELLQGGFMRDALHAACVVASARRGKNAEDAGKRLIRLFRDNPVGHCDGPLALALLLPWQSDKPGAAHQKTLLELLVARFGHPRLQTTRWSKLVQDMGHPRAGDFVLMVRRWLTERYFRQFFDVVGRTTSDPHQWNERSDFWLAYLDAGAVSDAWFALGQDAEAEIKSRLKMERHEYALIMGGAQTAERGQSSLVMRIGKLVIVEWSNNGGCRLWRGNDPQAPEAYKPQYYGTTVRAMNGGAGFERISHASSWQWRIARKIYSETGVQHPRFGQGLKFS